MGVNTKDGSVASIICSQDSYSNTISDGSIEYILPNRPDYRKALEAFKINRTQRIPLRVFRKIAVNNWEDLGDYTVSDITSREGAFGIILSK